MEPVNGKVVVARRDVVVGAPLELMEATMSDPLPVSFTVVNWAKMEVGVVSTKLELDENELKV